MTLRINSFNSSHSVFKSAQKLHAKKSSQRGCSKLQSGVAKRTINPLDDKKIKLEKQLTVEVKAWLEANFPNHPDIEALGDLISKLTRNPEHLAELDSHLIRDNKLARSFFESLNEKKLTEIDNLIFQLEEIEAEIGGLPGLQESTAKLVRTYWPVQGLVKPHA